MQRAAAQPLESILARVPVPKPSSLAADTAVELLQAPQGAIVKEGSASGKQIRRTRKQPPAQAEPAQASSVRSLSMQLIKIVFTARKSSCSLEF